MESLEGCVNEGDGVSVVVNQREVREERWFQKGNFGSLQKKDYMQVRKYFRGIVIIQVRNEDLRQGVFSRRQREEIVDGGVGVVELLQILIIDQLLRGSLEKRDVRKNLGFWFGLLGN